MGEDGAAPVNPNGAGEEESAEERDKTALVRSFSAKMSHLPFGFGGLPPPVENCPDLSNEEVQAEVVTYKRECLQTFDSAVRDMREALTEDIQLAANAFLARRQDAARAEEFAADVEAALWSQNDLEGEEAAPHTPEGHGEGREAAAGAADGDAKEESPHLLDSKARGTGKLQGLPRERFDGVPTGLVPSG